MIIPTQRLELMGRRSNFQSHHQRDAAGWAGVSWGCGA